MSSLSATAPAISGNLAAQSTQPILLNRQPAQGKPLLKSRVISAVQTDTFIRSSFTFAGAFVVSAGYALLGPDHLPAVGPLGTRRLVDALGTRLGCSIYCCDGKTPIGQWYQQLIQQTQDMQETPNGPKVSSAAALKSFTACLMIAYAGASAGTFAGSYLTGA